MSVCLYEMEAVAKYDGRYRLVHLALFGVRCWVAYCSGLGSSSWRFPGGQLKFEVSIQFLREPERETREGTV